MRLVTARCAALLLLAAGAAGCGGAGGVALTNPTRIEGSLDEQDSRFSDGSLADFYVATAGRGGRAQIEMKSTTFASYLLVSVRNSDGEIEDIIEDFATPSDLNAKVIFDVEKDKTYFVAAVDDGGSLTPGAYTLIFSDILKDVRVNPDSRP